MEAVAAIFEKYVKVFGAKNKLKDCNRSLLEYEFVIGDICMRANILPDRGGRTRNISTFSDQVSRIMLLDLREVHVEGGDVMLYNGYLFCRYYRGQTMQINVIARKN
jgi:hypothetical protein